MKVYSIDVIKLINFEVYVIGLRNYLLGFREGDSGHILENIIFFELMRRGYDVAIGKIGSQEVDFIATKADEKNISK